MEENKQDELQEKKEVLFDVNKLKTQEKYTLPSKGLLYSKEDKIPASITLRRMTTKEDKIRLRNTHELEIQRDILQACTIEDGVDIGKLKLPDANYLLFRLRQLSLLDDIYKVHCQCPYCKVEFVHEIDLNTLNVNYFNKESLDKFSVDLKICGHHIDLQLPNVNNMINLFNDFNEYVKAFPDADITDYLYTATNALYIKSINNRPMLREELESYLDSLDIIDNRMLIDAIDNLQGLCGFDENILTQCPECKKEIKHSLPITSELFTPSK